MKIVLASQNPGKLRELLQLSGEASWLELLLAPDNFQVEETGETFAENAMIKARAAAELTGMPAVADDSGLEVDALGGRPGVHSARYCQGDDQARRKKLLSEMTNVSPDKRQAAFVCSMAVSDRHGSIIYTSERRWTGAIAFEEKGKNGFGYDSIFYVPERNLHSAELPPQEKNRLSHRGQAWRDVLSFLEKQASEQC